MPESSSPNTNIQQGITSEDPTAAVEAFNEALEWEPANQNAQRLRTRAQQDTLGQQLHVAIQHVQRGDFEEAAIALELLSSEDQHTSVARAVTMKTALLRACTLAEQGNFPEALEHLCSTLASEAGQEPAHDLATAVRQLTEGLFDGIFDDTPDPPNSGAPTSSR